MVDVGVVLVKELGVFAVGFVDVWRIPLFGLAFDTPSVCVLVQYDRLPCSSNCRANTIGRSSNSLHSSRHRM